MKFSFGSSFAMAPGALAPVVTLDATVLQEGEPTRPIVLGEQANEAVLSIELPQVDVASVLRTCELSASSRVSLQIDLDCPGFDFVETLLSRVLPSSQTFSQGRKVVATIPRPVVVQGFAIKVSLVATHPVPSGLRGCSIPGGVLSSWETRVPSRNKASMFPLQDSTEAALWRLEVDIHEPEDLERPLRSALRLFVDSSRLEYLLGHEAPSNVQNQAIRWLQAESFTALVAHVLVNDSLREHVAAWLSMKPPIEKSLDPKSIGHFVLRVMRRLQTVELADLQRRMESDPVVTTNEIRSRMAVEVSQRAPRQSRQTVKS